MTTSGEDNVRWFIITHGRSGSSLLAAILADAGADFGMSAPDEWDPRTGAMEHPDIKAAAHHYRRAWEMDRGSGFILSPYLEARLRRIIARRSLRRALVAAHYAKISDLDLVVQPARKLGYTPRIILSYRQLEASLPGMITGRTHAAPDKIAEEYCRIYRHGLALLRSFGGCAVSFNDLRARQNSRWAEVLAEATGLPAEALRRARDARLKETREADAPHVVYPDALQLFQAMNGFKDSPMPADRRAPHDASPHYS